MASTLKSKPPDAPAPIAELDGEAFRRKIAGLADPSSGAGAISNVVIRDTAIRFVSILAHLFGEDLERITLWDRIGSALETADAKCSSDDTDAYATLCLEHIKAAPGRVAACDALLAVLGMLNQAKIEDRTAFLAYLRVHRFSALVHARARHKRVIAKEVEL